VRIDFFHEGIAIERSVRKFVPIIFLNGIVPIIFLNGKSVDRHKSAIAKIRVGLRER
jgi:hypothetical protein